MNFRFVKASPCRNTTVFVEDEAPLSARPEIARHAMDSEVLAAEQVGFLTRPEGAESVLRVEMAGGEFCGNASLSVGALAVSRGLCAAGKPFFVECSGAARPLRVSAEPVSSGRWRGTVEISSEAKISEEELSAAGVDYRGAVVELPGICHFCVEAEPFPKETYDELLGLLTARITAEAYGIIPYRETGEGRYSIRPYVAVPAAKSYVFEQACGSGSLALGRWLAKSEGRARIEVSQPGGTIRVEIGESASISEEVYFPCAGTFFVDDDIGCGTPAGR